MSLNANSHQETPLEKELGKLREQGTRVINAGINRLFDLKPKSAKWRMRAILFLLILVGFFIGLRPHPLDGWSRRIELVFDAIFLGDPIGILNQIIELVNLGLRVYISPQTLWYFPAFFLPIVIAHQVASFYLADVFELERIGIAQKFILEVALTGSNDVIRITNGIISAEYLQSPIYRIGGPGKVIVDLDSVVLFEKADGRPHVIQPTGGKPGGSELLEGFERYRQAIDLRDRFIDLRGTEGKFSAVKGRSLDGIAVTATDVRLLSSIHRGNQKPTEVLPYPFMQEAVLKHIYRATARVTNNVKNPSISEFDFESTILSMVKRELVSFMSQHRLTEYLASINLPEILKAEKQENAVVEEARLVLEPIESAENIRQRIPPRPPFVPRDEISSQFTNTFTKQAGEKGIELHWIGIGTWKVPIELVSEKHLDAWKMSRENEGMANDRAVESTKKNAKIQKIISMIQTIPLEVFENGINIIDDIDKAVGALLKEYRKQMNENYEQRLTKKRKTPPTLVAALFFIERMFWRNVPPPAPPSPETPDEDRLHRELLKKIGSWEVIERLVAIELVFTPLAIREELYRKINDDWDRDIAGRWKPS
jgi:hypothetical protein